jgi:hypothetical protein
VVRFGGDRGVKMIDLTGVWYCNDGATYYIRQLVPGSDGHLFWYGESISANPQWSNVGTGTFLSDKFFTIWWKDLLEGNNLSEMPGGVLSMEVSNESKLISDENMGGSFRGSSWWRLFMANSATKEVHVFDCEFAAKIANSHKVPYKRLEQAIKDGYNGCYHCIPEYHTPG